MLSALAGARKTLRRFKPRMAICVYHRGGDDVAIMKAVSEMVPDLRVSLQGLMLQDRIIAEVAHFY